jgi:threonine synthase
MRLTCMDCGNPYPYDQTPYKCPRCGGLFDDVDPIRWQGADPQRAGIWRYGPTLGATAVTVSLGEANTPLVTAGAFGRQVFFKCEHLNPTGSFRTRDSDAGVLPRIPGRPAGG